MYMYLVYTPLTTNVNSQRVKNVVVILTVCYDALALFIIIFLRSAYQQQMMKAKQALQEKRKELDNFKERQVF